MKHLTFIILLTSSLFQSSYGQLSLDDCQEKATLNYPLIKQYDLIEQSKEYNISNARKAYLPQFDVTVIGGIVSGFPEFPSPGEEAGSGTNQALIGLIQFNQILWDGGITKARTGMADASSEIEKANLDVNLYALNDRVNGIFFGSLLIDEQITQMKLFRSNLERNKTMVQNAIDGGTAYNSDLDEIEVELLNVDQKISELSYSKKAYTNMMSLLIGEELPEYQAFIKPIASDNYSQDQNNRPELSVFENQLKLIESQDKMNKSSLYPKVGLMAFGTLINPAIAFGPSEIDNILIAGLNLSWNISGLYQNGNNKKLSKINNDKILNQKASFLFNTSIAVSQIEQDIEKYKSLMERDQELLSLKTKIKKAYEIKYENGVCTMNDLLQRINDENVAKQNLIVHEIQYLMAIYKHKTSTGNLTSIN